MRYFWDLLGPDVVAFLQEFHARSSVPISCNSSFITLIPTLDNPLLIKDYRLITLIGLQFKITTKLLADRLDHVLNDVIVIEQPMFLKG